MTDYSYLKKVPRTSETYVHRSGRTARAAKEGLSLLLIGPDDMINYKKIYKTLGKDEDLPMFPIQNKCMIAIKVLKTNRTKLNLCFLRQCLVKKNSMD